MILVDNYILAILCCVYCCLCWGSWANTQKMVTSKSWSFELFYWDLSFSSFLSFSPRMIVLNPMAANNSSCVFAPYPAKTDFYPWRKQEYVTNLCYAFISSYCFRWCISWFLRYRINLLMKGDFLCRAK